MLVATPVLVYNLGIEQFGVYILMNSFVGFSLVFNFGFGDTILKYVSHYNTRGRKQRSAQIVRLVGMLALWTGLIVGVLLTLASSVIAKVFNIDGLAYAKPALHLVAVIAPLKMLESVYVGTLRGVYRYDLCGPVTTTTKILTVGSHAGLAILNYQLPVLLAVSAVLSGISTLVLFGICCRMLGYLTHRCSRRLFNKIKGFSAWSWVQGIAGILYISLDRLVIAAFLGPSVLGVYGVCVQISQNAHNAFAALSHTLFPRISSINSRRPLEAGGSNELHDVYVEASRRITVFSILVGSMVAIFRTKYSMSGWVPPLRRRDICCCRYWRLPQAGTRQSDHDILHPERTWASSLTGCRLRFEYDHPEPLLLCSCFALRRHRRGCGEVC
jgi:O-antigen/teichoic acid export membrane protein